MVTCQTCKLNFGTVDILKKHLKVSHGILLRSNCGERGCSRSLSTWKSYRQHLVNFHQCSVTSDVCPAVPKIVPAVNDDDELPVVPEVENAPGKEICIEEMVSLEDFEANFERNAEILIAKLYKKPTVPRNFVQTQIEDFNEFIGSGFLEILQNRVLSLLPSSDQNADAVKEITEMFEIQFVKDI